MPPCLLAFHSHWQKTIAFNDNNSFEFLLLVQVKAMKTGANWQRCDVTIKDANGEIQLKLWNGNANAIQEANEGAQATITNV